DVALWLQVRDLAATVAELRQKGVVLDREPRREPWGLDEAWLSDPDGTRIVLVEVPSDHPLRVDVRTPEWQDGTRGAGRGGVVGRGARRAPAGRRGPSRVRGGPDGERAGTASVVSCVEHGPIALHGLGTAYTCMAD